MNQELEQIFSHPDFIELVAELLGDEKTPLSVTTEGGDDEVTQRVQRMILLRIRKCSTEKEAHVTVTAG